MVETAAARFYPEGIHAVGVDRLVTAEPLMPAELADLGAASVTWHADHRGSTAT
ncbi:hypothetical protein ACIHDR_33615 [Nocardia sp. NPDC052278]|uniref:hypothetical protein n=1 Tax=unclassified Nocardia TaxID=2637762 RepID=UPI0036C48A56